MLGSDRLQANIPPALRRRSRQIAVHVAGGAVALTVLTAPTFEPAPSGPSAIHSQASARPLALLENRRVISYPMQHAWPTAIRYLKVDRGFEVDDHDREAGYMLFTFPLPGKRTGSGSLEMFETEDSSGRPSVSIAVNTGAGPVHLPHAILDGIAAKLRAERGQPAAPPPPSEKPDENPPEQDDPNDDHSVPLMPPAGDP